MTEKLLQALIEGQRETNRWLKAIALPALVGSLRKILVTERERRVYQESTGGTSREVGKAAEVSHQTVLTYWTRWAKAGLVEQIATGRYCRLVDLNDVALDEADG